MEAPNAPESRSESMCERCGSRPGRPYGFYVGRRGDTKALTPNTVGVIPTVTPYRVGMGDAAFCTTCLDELYRRRVLSHVIPVLGVVLVALLGLVLGPLRPKDPADMPVMVGFWFVMLIVALFFGLAWVRGGYGHDFMVGARGELAARLAIRLHEHEFRAKGWDTFWTPDEFAQSGLEVS